MTEKREKRKKIFYVPGMISLVLIPLFCICYFYKTNAFKDERCIDIYFPEDSIIQNKFLPLKRNYKIFRLNNLEIENKVSLNKLQFSLRELKRKNDTINGIRIHLGNKMSYEFYIKVLDILFVEKIENYIQYKNDFLVLVLPKPKLKKESKEIISLNCGFWEANKDYFIKQEKERKFNYVFELYKKYWILFLGYFGIVLLNIFTLVKFNKNKNYNQK
ncbi:hypothetical protein [Flavobacterium anhuiense]|uniref:hypothetical protein n=1 Tax=Flavobacterium anhuiense TaxID=459526 RepID=UPI003D956636